MIHCQVSHSLFLDPIFISYVYASCFMLVKEDLWFVLVAFADSNVPLRLWVGTLMLFGLFLRFLLGMPNLRVLLMLLI